MNHATGFSSASHVCHVEVRNCVTMETADKQLFEHVVCGCPKRYAINIPHSLIQWAADEGQPLTVTADRVIKQPKGREIAVVSAAGAMVQKGHLTAIPEGWENL